MVMIGWRDTCALMSYILQRQRMVGLEWCFLDFLHMHVLAYVIDVIFHVHVMNGCA
jgi:hypothetical protein